MKNWIRIALGTLLLLGPCVADDTAATPSSVPGDAAKPAKSDPDEIVCRRVTLTGTLIPGPKVCKARKLWEQQHQDSQDMLNQQTQKSLLNQPPGG